MRSVATFALIAFCSCFLVPVSRADVCMSPRVKRAKACGVVTDPYGMPIPRARINFGADGSPSFVITDKQGKFSIAADGADIRMDVDAIGFRSVETMIGSLKQPASKCKNPLFVMLTLDSEGCAMISARKSDLLLIAKKD